MPRLAFVNGQELDPGAPALTADDPGVVGQGVYESMRTYARRPFALGMHLDRLQAGSHALGVALDTALLEHEVARALRAAGAIAPGGELSLRVIVTASGTRVIEVGPLAHRSEAARAVTLPWRRSSESPLPGVRTTSTAHGAAAHRHLLALGADEGLWLTTDGRVSEAVGASVFAVLGGRLVTPPLSDGAIDGVTRALLLRMGAEERSFPPAALAAADEAFLAGTAHPARALIELDGRPIGGGQPGALTVRLAGRFADQAAALLAAS